MGDFENTTDAGFVDTCETLEALILNEEDFLVNSGLKILNMNIRSLDKNFTHFETLLSRIKGNIDVLCLTETWLRNEKFVNELDHYTKITSSSDINRASGVAFYVSKRINFEINKDFYLTCCDALFINVFGSQNDRVTLGVVYRSEVVSCEDFEKEWRELLEKASCNDHRMIVVGDFNLDVNFLNGNRADGFLDVSSGSGFRQVVSEITRPSRGGGSIIDLCFTNIPMNTKTVVIRNLITDHFPVLNMFDNLYTDLHGGLAGLYSWKKVDWVKFKDVVDSYNFDDVLESVDVNVGLKYLVDKLQKGLEICTEEGNAFRRFYCKKKPWMTAGILISIRKRERMKYKLNKGRGGIRLKERYAIYRNRLHSVLNSAQKMYYQNKIINSRNSSKAMWNCIKDCKGKSKVSNNVPNEIILNDGSSVSDPITISNYINNFFLNVNDGVEELLERDFMRNVQEIPTSVFFTPTSRGEIMRLIDSLKSKKTVGVDKISSKAIKTVKVKIVDCLVHLVNLMLNSGIFPSDLKVARVRLLFKGGDKRNMTNYRPISVLNVLSKISEKVIYERIYNFLCRKSFFADEQYGYRKGRSSEDAVAKLVMDINGALDKGEYVGMVSMDVKKAFDSVSHAALLRKLSACGIRGLPLELLSSYLNNRKQFIQFEECMSNVGTLQCGVPQGSILGPLLFIIFVNDIGISLKEGFYCMYADDNCIYVVGKTVDDLMYKIQNLVDKAGLWYNANGLILNSGKCKFIIFASPHKYNCLSSIIHTCLVNLGDTFLLPETKLKYLGVLLDCKLNWKDHIEYICGRLSSLVPIMYRYRNVFSVHILKVIYFALCHSVLYYAVVIYASTHKSKLAKLYALQKRILRIITFRRIDDAVDDVFRNLGILSIYSLNLLKVILMHLKIRCGKNCLPVVINRRIVGHEHLLRGSLEGELLIPRYKNYFGRFSITVRIPMVINYFLRHTDIGPHLLFGENSVKNYFRKAMSGESGIFLELF